MKKGCNEASNGTKTQVTRRTKPRTEMTAGKSMFVAYAPEEGL